MYNNVGKRIQIIAKVIGWLLLIGGLITWFMFCLNNSYSRDDLWGWLAFAFGIIGFVSSWFIYGFGQVVDDVHFLREKAEQNQQ